MHTYRNIRAHSRAKALTGSAQSNLVAGFTPRGEVAGTLEGTIEQLTESPADRKVAARLGFMQPRPLVTGGLMSWARWDSSWNSTSWPPAYWEPGLPGNALQRPNPSTLTSRVVHDRIQGPMEPTGAHRTLRVTVPLDD